MVMSFPKNPDGKYPAYAWPGGYPLLYICADGGVLCSACANGLNGSLASSEADENQWRIEGSEIYLEGDPEPCTHCGVVIHPAYEDEEEEEEEE